MQESKDSKGILNYFARMTTKNKRMTECDKIQLSYFIHYQSDKTSTEAYYCTKNGKVRGNLTLTEHLIIFDPAKCPENASFVSIDLCLFDQVEGFGTISSGGGPAGCSIGAKDPHCK